MSHGLYERYEDALRRGHVAALRGRHDLALDAYGEASELAPDRAMPLVGMARALVRLERPLDALAAFDGALDRAPGDESALQGRADLLAATGERSRAAETLDSLARVLDRAGRLAGATQAASRALELAEARERRAMLRALVQRLGNGSDDPLAAAALDQAARALAGGVADGPSEADPGRDDRLADALEATRLERIPTRAGTRPPEAVRPAVSVSSFVATEATSRVEAAVAAMDRDAVRERALEAATGHRTHQAPIAAIDACYVGLAADPADPDLHLQLADLYLDLGWSSLASDKLVLLDRLSELTDDPATRVRICRVAATRLRGDPRLARICAYVAGEATTRVEAAIEAGDVEGARDLALAAAAGHRANGALSAAIDACYLALGGGPADPDLHLALAELYLDRGWRTVAADKLARLIRLSDLVDDPATRERACRLAASRMADDPQLAQACA